MVHHPIGKGIMASMEYTPIIYSHDGKSIVLWNIVFSSDNRHGQRHKMSLQYVKSFRTAKI